VKEEHVRDLGVGYPPWKEFGEEDGYVGQGGENMETERTRPLNSTNTSPHTKLEQPT